MQITNENTCGGSCSGGPPQCSFSFIRDNRVQCEQGLNAFPNYDEAYYSIDSFDVDWDINISEIKNKLLSSPVYRNFSDYTSGIYEQTSGQFVDNHGVVIVSYNDTNECWICKNSWGTDWGENGYFRIAYGECGIDSYRAVTARVSVPSSYALITSLYPTLSEVIDSANTGETVYINDNQSLIENLEITDNLSLVLDNVYLQTSNGSQLVIGNGGNLTIRGDTQIGVNVFSNGDVIVEGSCTFDDNLSLTITDGANLTIEPSVSLDFGANSCLIIDEAAIQCEDVAFNFTSNTGGITIDNPSNYCSFNTVEISNAATGLAIENCSSANMPDIALVKFLNNDIGLRIDNTTATVTDFQIHSCQFSNNNDCSRI
ncbi:MAG: C1 family peptidase [candidate division KSB1 bacterium]|nr:C1 family peptidase [candidate division KSB1 bacterium]